MGQSIIERDVTVETVLKNKIEFDDQPQMINGWTGATAPISTFNISGDETARLEPVEDAEGNFILPDRANQDYHWGAAAVENTEYTALVAGHSVVPARIWNELADIATGLPITGAAGAELLDHAAPSWILGDGWLLAGIELLLDGTQVADTGAVFTNLAVSSSVAYKVEFTITNYVSGTVMPVIGGVNGMSYGENGTFIQVITSVDTTDFMLIATSDFVGDFEYSSIKVISQLGTEVISDPGFDDGGEWSVGAFWTVGSGTALCSGAQASAVDLINTGSSVIASSTYRVEYTIDAVSAGGVQPMVGGVVGVLRTVPGTYVEEIVTINTGTCKLKADVDFIGQVTSLSVKEIL